MLLNFIPKNNVNLITLNNNFFNINQIKNNISIFDKQNIFSNDYLEYKYFFDCNNLFNREIENKKNKLNNEFKFIINQRIKIFIHLEQLIYKTNIYHIGISFKSIFKTVRYDIGRFNISKIYFLNTYSNKKLKKKKIFWGYSNKSLNDIIDYEKSLNYSYFLGFNDCRHYVRNLTLWSTNNATPIWKLYNYF
tara:strand:- start:4383 stop:4958 length:576 start_codon:yes stop_codon:yes gene_type:complete